MVLLCFFYKLDTKPSLQTFTDLEKGVNEPSFKNFVYKLFILLGMGNNTRNPHGANEEHLLYFYRTRRNILDSDLRCKLREI